MQANNKSFYTVMVAALLAGGVLLVDSAPLFAREATETVRQMRESGDILPLEKISAAAKAIKPGEILETELEKKKGVYVYEVEILDAAGQVWELKLDAKTGKLIKLESED